MKERLTIEKEAWEQNYMKKQEAWLLAKEREVKEKVKVERDREIELVIGRLEDDGVQAREECERAAENRIKYDSIEFINSLYFCIHHFIVVGHPLVTLNTCMNKIAEVIPACHTNFIYITLFGFLLWRD